MVDVQRVVLDGSDVGLIIIGMPDRRTPAHRAERWLLQNQVRAARRAHPPHPTRARAGFPPSP